MFLRFVVRRHDEDSRSFTGLFTLAYELHESHELRDYEDVRLGQFLEWMRVNLTAPDCLEAPGNERAICWFKDTAATPLEWMWEAVSFLRERGEAIEMIKTDDPGTIIYEDEWQVAAKPRKADRIKA